MLAKLQNEQPVENAEIVTLAFHVDYWDYLGWKDKFSSAEYSQRQNDYTNSLGLNSNYTPQMIVDGKAQFVGSNSSKALTEIDKATGNKKGLIEITLQKELLNPSLKVKISGLNPSEDADVYLAITEDELETDVKRGENNGKKLSHMSVVRELQQVGNIATAEKTFEIEKTVKIDSLWNEKNLNFVVFVQNKNSKNVVAIGKTKLK